MNGLAGKAFILILTLFISICLFGQTNTAGSWNVINTKVHFVNNNGFIFFEGVVRSQKLTNIFNYHDLKIGIVYNPSDKIGLHFGLGDYVNYNSTGNFESPAQTEMRIWEQIQLNLQIGMVKLDHRYRIEQRFFSSGFRNRFRYRLNTTIPVVKTKNKSRILYMIASDEIFLTNTRPFFEKNRWLAGLTYSFNKYFAMQMAWIHDNDLRKNGITTTKNYIQTSLLFDIYYTNNHRRNRPETAN